MALTAESMRDYIIANYPGTDATSDDFILALCRGIVQEIQTNSVLIPISTDSGSAGAGIIQGKVG